jgi:hypothetical protein
MKRELEELRRSLAADPRARGGPGDDLTHELRDAQQHMADDLERWVEALERETDDGA